MNDFTDNLRRGIDRSVQQSVQRETRNLVGGFANMFREMLIRPVQAAEREATREVGRGMNGIRREAGLPEQQLPRGATPGFFPGRPGYEERPLPTGDSQIRVGGRVYTEGGRPQATQASQTMQTGNMTAGQVMSQQSPDQKRLSAQALGLGDKAYDNLIAKQLEHEDRAARGQINPRYSPVERAAKIERASFAKSGLSEEEWGKIKIAENDYRNRLLGGGNVDGKSPITQVLDADAGKPAFQRPSAGVAAPTTQPAEKKWERYTNLPDGSDGLGEYDGRKYGTKPNPSPSAQELTAQGGLKASDYKDMRGGGDGAVSTAPAAAPAATAPAASGDATAGIKHVDAYNKWKQQNPGLSQ